MKTRNFQSHLRPNLTDDSKIVMSSKKKVVTPYWKMMFHSWYEHDTVFLGHFGYAESETKLCFTFFHKFYNFFLTFFRKFQNMSIFSSIIANTCIWVCKHEIHLGRKIWKIQVSWIDRSNILCTSLQKPFQIF